MRAVLSARPVEATKGGPRWQHAFGEALAQAEAYELRASVGLTGAKRKHAEAVRVEADSDCATDDGVVAVEATVAAGSGEDCGECATCLDKPNFGGPGPKRRACLVKKTPPSGATAPAACAPSPPAAAPSATTTTGGAAAAAATASGEGKRRRKGKKASRGKKNGRKQAAPVAMSTAAGAARRRQGAEAARRARRPRVVTSASSRMCLSVSSTPSSVRLGETGSSSVMREIQQESGLRKLVHKAFVWQTVPDRRPGLPNVAREGRATARPGRERPLESELSTDWRLLHTGLSTRVATTPQESRCTSHTRHTCRLHNKKIQIGPAHLGHRPQ